MIELIYTDNINWNLYDYDSIIDLIDQLNNIKEFLNFFKGKTKMNEIFDLIDLYKEKYNEFIKLEKNYK